MQFSTKADAQEYLVPLRTLFSDRPVFTRDTEIMVNTHAGRFDMEKAFRFLLEQQIPCNGVQIVQPTLEDVFLRLTAKNGQGEWE